MGGGGIWQDENLDAYAEEPTNPDDNWANHYANSFAGGTGTESDPYQIETAEQLAFLAYQVNNGINYYDSYFLQTTDINLSAYWWDAIGTTSRYFQGNYDGDNHTVSGIFTPYGETSDFNYQGLFGFVSGKSETVKAEIKNLGVINSFIQGNDKVGGIAGFATKYTTIINCYNTARINGHSQVAGIVGCNQSFSSVINCYNLGLITGDDSSIAGIAGFNNISSLIENCYNAGTVQSINDNHENIYIGGMTGSSNDYSIVINCYNIASITGYHSVGGIVGVTNGNAIVSNCYNTGEMTGDYNLGGIIGYNYNYSTTTNCFNIGKVSVSSFSSSIGGVLGVNQNSTSVILNSYYGGNCEEGLGGIKNSDVEGQAEYLGTITTDAKTESWYFDSDVWNNEYPWDFDIIWAVHPWINNGLPYLQNINYNTPENLNYLWTDEEVRSEIKTTFEGSGTEDDPYLISTPAELAGLAYNVNFGGQTYAGKYFKQTADIDVSKYWWDAIGTNPSPFRGNYDGDNHTVSGIFTPYGETSDFNYQGLFGYIRGTSETDRAEISNIGIINSYIQGYKYIGAIAGYVQYTNIDNCYNASNVEGNSENIGGIVGWNSTSTTISNCYNTGIIIGGNKAGTGGITGYNYKNSVVENCYNLGNINSDYNFVGGIAGIHQDSSIIKNCYNAGNINGGGFTGGIVGSNESNSLVSNCYNLGEVFSVGRDAIGGILGSNTNTSTLVNCYNLGRVSNSINAGFVGTIVGTSKGNLYSCYFGGDCDESDKGTGNVTEAEVEYLSTIETDAKTKEWFVDNTAGTWNSEYPWDFTYTWKVNPAENEGYPTLYQYSLPKTDYMWTDEEVRSEIKTTFEGSGTEDDPYLISTPAELAGLAYNVNFGGQTYAGKYFKQTADIDVSKYWWDAIGYYNSIDDRVYFQGHYDGYNYIVSGLFTPYVETDQYSYQGLFGYVLGGLSGIPTISNVGIVDSFIQGYEFVGGVAGYAYRTIIENCYSNIEISGYTSVGGILGYGYDNVILKNNYSLSSVFGMHINLGGICGGIYFNSQVINCYNSGKILGILKRTDGAFFGAGGIVGNVGENVKIENCYNTGSVFIDNYYSQQNASFAGGIAGQLANSSIISNCYNTGDITGDAFIGGICGTFNSSSIMSNCYNLGLISSYYSSWAIGGVVGLNSSATMSNCFNLGEVISLDSTTTGGVAGHLYDESVTSNCYYGGNCELTNVVGSQSVVEPINCGVITETDAKSGEWYLNTSNWNESYLWDFVYVWTLNSLVNQGYPTFKEVTITYHSNNSENETFVETHYASSVPVASDIFSQTGYEITSWNTNANGTGINYTLKETYQIASDLDLYAQWDGIVYTISLDNQTGTGGTSEIYVKYNTGFYSNLATTTLITEIPSLPTRLGYTFQGYYTGTNGAGTRIVDDSGNILASNIFTMSNITIYASWTANVPAYYDEEGKYWYIELGKMPQTKVMQREIISVLNGDDVLNDNDGVTTSTNKYYFAETVILAKIYNGEEYCNFLGNWYKVEPIRWRIATPSSTGYVSTHSFAVMETIVYVGKYSSNSIGLNEGYISANSGEFSAINYFLNNFSDREKDYLTMFSASSQKFMSTGKTKETSSNNIFLSSREEIESVGGSNACEFSDLVVDYLNSSYGGGQYYYVRDLGSNLYNVTAITQSGGIINQRPTYMLGMRLTIKVTEFVTQ